jgi:hypothetical protein
MKSSCYFVLNHCGTWELKILLDSFLQLTTDSKLPLEESVTPSIILGIWLHSRRPDHIENTVLLQEPLRNLPTDHRVPRSYCYSARTTQETQPHLLLRNLATDCLPRICLRGNLFTNTLPNNGCIYNDFNKYNNIYYEKNK